jgi:hypothetical protein
MKRFVWTIAMAAGGYVLGLKGATEQQPSTAFIGALWAGAIGFGLGSIFSASRPTKWLVAYWGGSLALIGAFLSLLIAVPESTARGVIVGIVGGAVGLILGFLIGLTHMRRLK